MPVIVILAERKRICDYYLQNISFNKKVYHIKIRQNTEWNYAYFSIIFSDNSILLQVIDELNMLDIFPRRYFFPSLNTIGLFAYEQNMPISESISERILCLPIYFNLELEIMDEIVRVINKYS